MGTRENAEEINNRDRNPVVSVVMGTYEPDISELSAAVRSIRMQTLSSWELLICDDGSTEETYRNIKKLAACDPRIRVSRNSKNRGLAYALNRCILHAGGEFIARMDADDISRPERFMKQVKFLRENPEYMWISGAADLFEGKRVWGSAYRPEMPDARSFLHSSPYIHPAVMFRREVFFSSACPEEPPAGRSKCSGMPAGSSSAEHSKCSGMPESSSPVERSKFSGISESSGKHARTNSPKRLYHVSPLTAHAEDYELFMRLHSEGLRGYNLQEPLLLYREKERTLSRSFRRCFFEMLIRIQGFARLGILSPRTLFYVVKPVFVGIASLFPGIAQSIRTGGRGWDRKNPPGEPESASVYVTSGERALKEVFAPLITAFTVWVLREAETRGIKRLYFLSRDGYLPYRTAIRLVKSCKLDIECRYLYCSRYSLRVPMYSENVDEALSHVTRGGIDVTFRKILLRSGFRAEDIPKMQAAFPDLALDEVIPYSGLRKVRARLAGSSAYKDLLKERSEEAWEPLCAYFRQEGLLEGIGACDRSKEKSDRVSARYGSLGKSERAGTCDENAEKIGIVDSGWTGTTQKSIAEIRRRCGIDDPVEGFYFGLFEIPKGSDPERYHSFYFGPKTKLFNKVFFSNSLFEALVRTDHGTVSGYRKVKTFGKDGEVRYSMEPILEPCRMNGIAEKLDQYICKYMNEITDREHPGARKIPAEFDGILTPALAGRLKKFMWNPDPDEAEYFGSLPFSDDLLDETEREVAPVFPGRYLKENHFVNRLLTSLGIRKGTVHESAWFEATCVRSAERTGSSDHVQSIEQSDFSDHAQSIERGEVSENARSNGWTGFFARSASIGHRISFSVYKAVSYLRKGLFVR